MDRSLSLLSSPFKLVADSPFQITPIVFAEHKGWMIQKRASCQGSRSSCPYTKTDDAMKIASTASGSNSRRRKTTQIRANCLIEAPWPLRITS